MGYVVALKGEESKKVVDGREQRVIPFVGTDREGKFAHLGVGVILPDYIRFGRPIVYIWGLLSPHNLIQSWRGMKILEQIKEIKHGTLCACWYAGGRKICGYNQRYLDELAQQFKDPQEFYALRAKILSSMPTSEELQLMLFALWEKGVEVDAKELEEEMRSSSLERTQEDQGTTEELINYKPLSRPIN